MKNEPVAMLDSFSAVERAAALRQLRDGHKGAPVASGNVNMHMHSFFSYNAEGFSPSHLAWAAHSAGLRAAGMCDFDVLDGLEEFTAAGLLLGLRTSVHLETRAYFREYANVDISSPGEHGVTYIMGCGFAAVPAPGTPQADMLQRLRRTARERNEALIARINPQLREIAIRYEADVLPLTPAGGATERHIIRAYINKSVAMLETPQRLAEYWACILGMAAPAVLAILDSPALDEKVRSKLAKRGGLGYEEPTPDTFPPVDDFVDWVSSCEAIPTITWLDGTSGGESDPRIMMECMTAKGAAALNIVPDRNWNVPAGEQAAKRANLKAIVQAAEAMHLPINIGTELNRLGLPFVDDLEGPVLREYRDTFVRGAQIMVGHSLLARYAGMSYVGEAARREFPDVAARNAFFAAVGGLKPLDETSAESLRAMGAGKALAWFHDRVRRAA